MNESNPSDAALAELLTLTMEVDTCGETSYRNQSGLLHRVHGPAVITSSGHRYWYHNGWPHRKDGAAVELYYGHKVWYLYGKKYTEREFNEQLQSLR